MSRPEERAASIARAGSYYVLVALGAGLWWLLSRDGGLPFVIGVCAAAVLIVGRLLALGVSYWRFARQDRRDRTSHQWEQPQNRNRRQA